MLELKESYLHLLENIGAPIIIVQDGIIKFLNPITQEIIGYSTAEILNTHFIDLINFEDRDTVAENLQIKIKGEKTSDACNSFRIKNKTKAEVWTKLTTTLIAWRGKPGILCLLKDVTEQKKMEARFFQAQKLNLAGKLALGIVHDVNNLLEIIIMDAKYILKKLNSNSPLSKYIEEIIHEGKDAGIFINELLTLGRGQVSNPIVLDLNKAIKDFQNILLHLLSENIVMNLFLSPDVMYVKFDYSYFRHIIMNLVVNARDAMPYGGKLTIKTASIKISEQWCLKKKVLIKPGFYVKISVRDTGVGMNKETIAYIFKPFFTTKEKNNGTGLGLFIVYSVVKQNGGFIFCKSKLNKGTTFELYLPQTH